MPLTSFVVDRKLIFVLGVQRSGTTALLDSLGQDPSLRVEEESPAGPIYDRYRLRPEPDVHHVLWRIPKRVILKPLVSLFHCTVSELLREFVDYGPQAAFVYRDPLRVWQSTQRAFGRDDEALTEWLDRWFQIHRALVSGLAGPFGGRIALVRYEDLLEYPNVFRELCDFLAVSAPNSVFRLKSGKGPSIALPQDVIERINDTTCALLSRLDRHRTMRPTPFWQPFVAAPKPSPASGCQIEITLSGVGGEWWQQEFSGPRKIDAGQPGELSFHARSASSIDLEYGLGHGTDALFERHSVGLARLGPSWQRVAAPFSLQSPDDDCRVAFRFAIRPGQIEIAAPRLAVVGQDPTAAADKVDSDAWESSAVLRIHVSEMGGGVSTHAGKGPWLWQRVFLAPRASIGDEPYFAVTVGNGRFVEFVEPFDSPPVRIPSRAWIASDETLLQVVQRIGEPNWGRFEWLRSVKEEDPPAQSWRRGYRVKKGERYAVRCQLRADSATEIGVGVSQSDPPWAELGFYKHLAIGPEWREFYFEFQSIDDEENARVLLDLGRSEIPVEVDNASIEPEPDAVDDKILHRVLAIAQSLLEVDESRA